MKGRDSGGGDFNSKGGDNGNMQQLNEEDVKDNKRGEDVEIPAHPLIFIEDNKNTEKGYKENVEN